MNSEAVECKVNEKIYAYQVLIYYEAMNRDYRTYMSVYLGDSFLIATMIINANKDKANVLWIKLNTNVKGDK